MPSIVFLWDAAAKATVILAARWLPTLAMRRRSAAARYFTWTCALAAVLAVPAISPLLPGWDLRVKAPAVPSMARAATIADAAHGTASDSPGWSQQAHARRTTGWPVPIWLAGVTIMLARASVGHLRLALSLRRAQKAVRPNG